MEEMPTITPEQEGVLKLINDYLQEEGVGRIVEKIRQSMIDGKDGIKTRQEAGDKLFDLLRNFIV